MSIIYEPKGKAREYCELAINLYRGCEHGCTYCYAPDMLYLRREQFVRAERRRGNGDLIDKIRAEAPDYSGREIQLCFTCDPYQKIDEIFQYTRHTIKILTENDITVRILTKAGKKSMRDFDILRPRRDWYGATLTFTDIVDSARYEPSAALPEERMMALRVANALGIRTWASLEPVIDPAQSLAIIVETCDYVDVYKIGKWNYDKRADGIDWRAFAMEAVALLKKHGKAFYLKNDLRKFLE